MIEDSQQQEQAPEQGGQEQEGQEQAPEQREPELTPEQKKLAVLEAELERLKAERQAPAQAPQQVTLSQLEGYSSEQWEAIEQRTGRSKSEILNDYRAHELTARQNHMDAKTNTTEAIQDALEENPRLLKLRGDIREYMDDVPVTDKLDKAKLKRHLDRAISYAKGKNMSSAPAAAGQQPKLKAGAPAPKGGEMDDIDMSHVEGEMQDGEYTNETGLRIKLGKVDKAVWKQIRSKTREPNSVTIPKDFDKPPKFN